MALTFFKYRYIVIFIVVVTLGKFMNCQRTGPAFHLVYYGKSLLPKESRSRSDMMQIYRSKPFSITKSKEHVNKIFYTMERRNNDIKKSFDLGQLHNTYLSNNNYFKKPVAFNNAGYGFKDEYFPQKYYNDDQIVNRVHRNPPKYTKLYSGDEFKGNTNYLKFSTFKPKTIPLIRQTSTVSTVTNMPYEPWKKALPNTFPAQTSTNLRDPTSESQRTLNPIKATKTNTYETNTQLVSNLFSRGGKTYHTSPNFNSHVAIYGIHQNTPPAFIDENVSQTKRLGSQYLQIVRAQYPSEHEDGIPKSTGATKPNVIISKDTSRHFNSDKSSVDFNVGDAEGPTNDRINKNFYSGLRHSRLNNFAVVVSSSMRVKED